MYYQEIPKQILEKLQKPLDQVTEEAVLRRLNQLFGSKWKNEITEKQLFAITLPMVSSRGMEILTTVSIWLIKSTVSIPVNKDELISRSSYIISPIFDEDSRKENIRLAFLNTAVRKFLVGVDEKRLPSLSLEKDLLARKLFFSEKIGDYIFDLEAIKVILAKEQEKEEKKALDPSERRGAPRKTLPLLKSIPISVTIDRRVVDSDMFLLDFSSSGLRIISAFNFPENKPFTIYLNKEDPIPLWCELVWKNALFEELNQVAIKFVKLHLDKFEKLCRFFEKLVPKKEEGDVRINQIIQMELQLWDQPRKLSTFIHSITSTEMRIMFPSYLQEGLKTICRIYPPWNMPPFESEVEVVSSQVLKEGGCLAVLSFFKVTEKNRDILDGFMQKCSMEERHSKKY
ncbi:MAG: PilZ domain-containing protein [Candidatus Xenobiia bacterium LiM19]